MIKQLRTEYIAYQLSPGMVSLSRPLNSGYGLLPIPEYINDQMLHAWLVRTVDGNYSVHRYINIVSECLQTVV